jgi:hypothetical protein
MVTMVLQAWQRDAGDARKPGKASADFGIQTLHVTGFADAKRRGEVYQIEASAGATSRHLRRGRAIKYRATWLRRSQSRRV